MEFAFNPIDKFNQKLHHYYKKFECAFDVIEEAVNQTEFQSNFDESKQIVGSVIEDVKNCEDLKCELEIVKDLPEYFANYFEIINKENQKLVEKVSDKCFVFEDTFETTPIDEIQCIVDVLGEVSKTNGLDEVWSSYQPAFQRHIDKLKNCPNAGSKIMRIMYV